MPSHPVIPSAARPPAAVDRTGRTSVLVVMTVSVPSAPTQVIVVCMSSTGEAPWWFNRFGPSWFTRCTAVLSVLMPVLLVSHLLFHKHGDPTFTSLAVLLAAMSLSWPLQLLRIRASRRWVRAHESDADTR